MKGETTLIVLLLIVLAVLVGMHWVVLPDPSQRNFEYLPAMNMFETPAHEAQATLPELSGETAFDPRPPEGSIARGYPPLGYAATPDDALRAGRELEDPLLPEDADALSRGAFVYATFCNVCHGVAGGGDGTVTSKGVPPPPSLLLDHAVQMSDGQIFHVISFGQGNMASYDSQIERDDRWRVIRHIRTLQQATAAGETQE